MANHSISNNMLKPGSIVFVTGLVDFCRITRRIEGRELENSDKRAVANGMSAVGKPHTKIDLMQCSVLAKDPSNPTLEERYIQERLYARPRHPEKGYCYTGMNKGSYPPFIAVRKPDGGARELGGDEVKGELANGLRVTIVLRVFKGSPNNGISMDGVIAEEPIRWYEGNAFSAIAAGGGITIEPAKTRRTFDTAPAEQPAQAPYGTPAQPAQNPYGAYTPADGTPVAPPVGNPYSTGNAAPASAFGPNAMQPPMSDGNPFPQPGASQGQPSRGIVYNGDRNYGV